MNNAITLRAVYRRSFLRFASFLASSLAVVLAAGLLLPRLAFAEPVVANFEWLTDIPVRPPIGGFNQGPWPTRINSLGDIVGYYSTPSVATNSFAYVDGVFVSTSLDPDILMRATAINDQQQIVGFQKPTRCDVNPCGSGFTWDLSSGFDFHNPPNVGDTYSYFSDINNSGTIAGRELTPSGYVPIRVPGGELPIDGVSDEIAINDLGHMAGYAGGSLWMDTGSGPQNVAAIPFDNTPQTIVAEMNNRNQVVGSVVPSDGVRRMFLHDESLQLLPIPSGYVSSHAGGIDEEGRIVGSLQVQAPLPPLSILWEEGVLYDLSELVGERLEGGSLYQADDISDTDGWIVGTGFLDGDHRVWRAKLQLPNEFRWLEPVDGEWTDGTKWDRGRPPGPGEIAIFEQPGAYEVDLTENTTVDDVKVLSGDVSLHFNNFWLESGGLQLGTPSGDPAGLTLTKGDGVSVAASTAVASLTEASTGTNATEPPSANQFVTRTAPLEIRGGLDSEFRTPDISSFFAAKGTIVDGKAVVGENGLFRTTGLVIGESDEGLLQLQPGSTTIVEQPGSDNEDLPALVLGDEGGILGLSPSDGELTLDGSSMLVEGRAVIGVDGDAFVSVQSGGFLNATQGIVVADDLGSEAALVVYGSANGRPSTLLVGSMNVGRDGDALVNILDGGHAEIEAFGTALWQIGGDSQLEVSSTLVRQSARVVLPESAQLVIEIAGPAFGDATMLVGAEAIVEATEVSVGIKNLEGLPDPIAGDGTLEVTGQPSFSPKGGLLKLYEGLIVGRQGEVEITNGGGVMVGARNVLDLQLVSGFDPANKLVIFEGGSFQNAGVVTVGTFANRGATFVSTGAIHHPGNSTGRSTFISDFIAEEGSQLVFEIAGTTPAGEDDAEVSIAVNSQTLSAFELFGEGEHDVLEIHGDVQLHGTIVFEFIDSFAPQQGQQFEFLRIEGLADLSDAKFEIKNLAAGFLFDIMPTDEGFMMTALNNGRFVPEPAAGVLFGLAAAGLFPLRKR